MLQKLGQFSLLDYEHDMATQLESRRVGSRCYMFRGILFLGITLVLMYDYQLGDIMHINVWNLMPLAFLEPTCLSGTIRMMMKST